MERRGFFEERGLCEVLSSLEKAYIITVTIKVNAANLRCYDVTRVNATTKIISDIHGKGKP